MSNEIARRTDIAAGVEIRVAQMLDERTIDILPGYPWRNALKMAWSQLVEATYQFGDKKGQLILDNVTVASVSRALLRMVNLGLDPSLGQVDFIPYGRTLTADPSRFGDQAIAQRLGAIVGPVHAQTVHEGDYVKFRFEDGRRLIEEHTQELASVDAPIVGVYAVATLVDGTKASDFMTAAQVKTSWKASKNTRADRPHVQFEGEMFKRTVVRRLLKPLIKGAAATHSTALREALDEPMLPKADQTPLPATTGSQGLLNALTAKPEPVDDAVDVESRPVDVSADGEWTPSPEELAEIEARDLREAGLFPEGQP